MSLALPFIFFAVFLVLTAFALYNPLDFSGWVRGISGAISAVMVIIFIIVVVNKPIIPSGEEE